MRVSTLRPGLLVNLRTRVSGNVKYFKRDIEADHQTEEGIRRAVWETERTIEDPDEHDRAIKVQGKARAIISRPCSISEFGLLCPEAQRSALDQAIREARDLAREFNDSASLTQVDVHVMVGRIAADDLEAVRSINSEVRDLLERMEKGVRKLDVETIRKAANEAAQLGQMLSPEASDKVKRAVEYARAAAKRIKKDGEVAAEVMEAQIRIIRSSAGAFLDLEDAAEVAKPETSAAAAVDFAPVGAIESVRQSEAAEIEL